MFSMKKLVAAGLAVATIAGSTVAMTDTANARGWGHGGGWHGGFRGGRGFPLRVEASGPLHSVRAGGETRPRLLLAAETLRGLEA